jgi:hypothetical protein
MNAAGTASSACMIESRNPSNPGRAGAYTRAMPSCLAAFADVLPMHATAGQLSDPAICTHALRIAEEGRHRVVYGKHASLCHTNDLLLLTCIENAGEAAGLT